MTHERDATELGEALEIRGEGRVQGALRQFGIENPIAMVDRLHGLLPLSRKR
jgi:hypothetical protein